MALTIARASGALPTAPLAVLAFDVDLDGSYPQATGGYDFDPTPYIQEAGFNAGQIVSVWADAADGYVFVYDAANKKLKVYWCAAAGNPLAEVTNATNLAGVTGVRVVVLVA